MEFKSKYGLGEIVLHSISFRGVIGDEIFKVIQVIFNLDGTLNYVCRRPDGFVACFSEEEVHGDPEFDQKEGYKNDK